MGGVWVEQALTPEGWRRAVRLVLADGKIARIEPAAQPAPGEERCAIALPGLGNVHSHAFQRGMAGLTEHRGEGRDDFWSWRELMYRFLDHLTPDDVEAIAALAFCEMLEAGFTRVGEFHYLHHDPAGRPYARIGEMAERIGAAAARTGIGLTLLPVFYAHAGFGGASPTAGQRRFITDVEGFARLHEACGEVAAALPDGKLGVAPHSLRAVEPRELAAVVSLGGEGGIHIHAAEQRKEVADCLAWSGRRPVEWLLDEARLDARWRLIHATHMSRDETARLAASGAIAGFCPITEANLGDGVSPARSFLAADGAFAVGTDSNVRIEAAGELAMLEYGQRLTGRARNVLAPAGGSTGRRLFAAAHAGGARALGETSAGLAVGASADIVALDADDPALAGRSGDALLDSWIFAGARIEGVWRRGVKVVEAGRHREREAIAGAYRRRLKRILAA